MFFLLRIAFWLAVVCVLLPTGSSQPTAPESQINATEAVSLASATVSDMRGFCDRQPKACLVGGKLVVAIGHKAEAGARTLYEFITTKLGEASEAASKPKLVTDRNGTLSPTDLQPAWRATVPLPPRRPAA
jgi:hypothetical protein